MRVKVFVLLAILTALIKFEGLGQSLPTKKEQYDFLKWYLKYDKPEKLSDTLNYLEDNGFATTDLQGKYGTLSLKLSKQSIKFIGKQLKKNHKINLLDTAGLSVRDWKTSDGPRVPVSHISLPVFTANKKIVFIYRAYYCGSLCGSGAVEAYQIIKGKWERLKLPLPIWIS
ncbi:hypothetical protein [Mucilaginibacter agri]|uniref:Uncharacterized protein n=1 Tax=Mucilaginibacter agri TaxID=2695265 RepID=A0A965ZH64_9SPHI|nr:hypothetical protein [Mucilaginibacter agri]NCD70640.1 hypothetical protein [Mucilaginibacter agri]